MPQPLMYIYFLAILGLLSAVLSASEKPNIIIIMADDLGYGDVGCFGSKRFKTPNIDVLARGGVRFTDFHSNGASCSPTRAAMMTGRYQQRTGIVGVITAKRHRHTGLALEEMTFAEVAKGVGYTTALFGKWHLGYQPRYNPVHQGFDEFAGFVSGNVDYHAHLDQTGVEDWWKQKKLIPQKGYTTDLITDHGVDFIRRNKDKPFLLYLAHAAPHYPYQGRKDPPRYTREKGRTKDPHSLSVYKEMIEVMDEGIGRIHQAVKQEGISDRTLIIFTSDNGPAGPGSAGLLRGKKGTIFEGGHRVPTVMCWPGHIEAGRVSNETAMTMDLLPTIAAVTGAAQRKDSVLDGINLFPHLVKGSSLPSRALFWQHGEFLAVRKGNYKLMTNRSYSNPQLYDLKIDLREGNDIARKNPEVVKALLGELKTWHQGVTEGVQHRTGPK